VQPAGNSSPRQLGCQTFKVFIQTWGALVWNRTVLSEKLMVLGCSRNSPRLMEPEGSLPHSQ
jgi:hypothetical protein